MLVHQDFADLSRQSFQPPPHLNPHKKYKIKKREIKKIQFDLMGVTAECSVLLITCKTAFYWSKTPVENIFLQVSRHISCFFSWRHYQCDKDVEIILYFVKCFVQKKERLSNCVSLKPSEENWCFYWVELKKKERCIHMQRRMIAFV